MSATMVRAPVASSSAASLLGAGLPPTKPTGFMPAATAAAMPGAESSTTIHAEGSASLRAAASKNRSGAGLPLRTALAEKQRGSKKRIKPVTSRLARTRSGGEDDATAFGPRIQVSACAAGAMGRQFRAQAVKRLRRNERRKIGRQQLSGGRLDGGENVGRPASVEPAHRAGSGQPYADPAEGFGKHRGGNWFAVNKHAVTIEDDHWSLRRFGLKTRPPPGFPVSP